MSSGFDDLRCNSLDCRALLVGSCVVTTCSHVFCTACASVLFVQATNSDGFLCPACQTLLADSDDVVQASLQPSNAYKTSVLSGLHPSVIFDICSRALNFYSYQISQEVLYQSMASKKSQERVAVLEAQCQNIIREATSEIHLLKERAKASERELEIERRKSRDLHETHKQNAKAYNKLKSQYDRLQQRYLIPNNLQNQTQSQLQPAPPPSPAPLSSHAHSHSRTNPTFSSSTANTISKAGPQPFVPASTPLSANGGGGSGSTRRPLGAATAAAANQLELGQGQQHNLNTTGNGGSTTGGLFSRMRSGSSGHEGSDGGGRTTTATPNLFGGSVAHPSFAQTSQLLNSSARKRRSSGVGGGGGGGGRGNLGSGMFQNQNEFQHQHQQQSQRATGGVGASGGFRPSAFAAAVNGAGGGAGGR